MKKLIIALGIVAASLSVHAQHRMPHYNYGHNGANWIVPSLITGLIVYGVTRPEPQIVYVTPPPPIVEQRPIVISEEPVYRKVDMYDPACSCVKQVYVQIVKEYR